ncbi:valine--tRNA ligase [Candidatus Zinderia endosymbiont of Aphrophora alni]|uniref:valine--tRNA ligase n=1 Tax=Candidatus Zinderia endosymbiont of Aphrophora alni TaxID=3077951 RepID=UPI0030D4CBBA
MKKIFFLKKKKTKKIFCIQLPPPNITGILHLGHAFNQIISDILMRYHFMMGYKINGIFGTDHAGIATQLIIEKQLKKINSSKEEIGKIEFKKKIFNWKKKSENKIKKQIKKIGISIDFKKKYFTMNKKFSSIVKKTFVKLFNDNLIYKKKKIVNWDPTIKTVISDLEIKWKKKIGKIWNIKYNILNSNKYIVVSTTRPETIFGDVAIAINPKDDRYHKLKNKMFKVPIINKIIPIIADEKIKKEFGTGLVKITPAHNFIDYEISKKHNLEKINIFTTDVKINKKAPYKYQGMDRFQARVEILKELKKNKLIESYKLHKINIPYAERTNAIIEPMLMNQWFIAVNKPSKNNKYFYKKSLAEITKEKINNKEIIIIPSYWKKTFNKWINNIQDWCISRQLWWGHKIPAWYDEKKNIYVTNTKTEAIKKAKNKKIIQEKDVLDTWFSSALIPFATIKLSKKKKYNPYLPSSILITGFDIIFFWVIRMIMMTAYFTGKIPFKKIYIHGIIKDKKGKKMSKFKGNTINPIDIINKINSKKLIKKKKKKIIIFKKKKKIPKFGTDVLRFTLLSLATPNRNINFDFNKCIGYKKFCNKIWNATNFVITNIKKENFLLKKISKTKKKLLETDLWIISLIQKIKKNINFEFNNCRFDYIALIIYKFIWNEYCNWYLEFAKIQINFGDIKQKNNTKYILLIILIEIIKILHPIMPFLTKKLWDNLQNIFNKNILYKKSIINENYPLPNLNKINNTSKLNINKLKKIIEACRILKKKNNISNNTIINLQIKICNKNKKNIKKFFIKYTKYIQKIIYIKKIKFIKNYNNIKNIYSYLKIDNIKLLIFKKNF